MDPATANALAAARHLASVGVRLFVAEPNWTPGDGLGFKLPYQWEKVAVADPGVVDQWRPDWALCAVGDGPVSFVDLDPPQGENADALELALIESGLQPVVYGVQRTPSGGAHLLVAGLDAPKAENVIPGVDVRAGRRDGSGAGFVFLAPTARAPKWDRSGPRLPYSWQQLPRLNPEQLAQDTSGQALAERLRAGKQRERTQAPQGPQPSPGASYAAQFMAGQTDGPRVMRTTEQAWDDIHRARQLVLTCTEHAGAHEAVRDLAWELARYSQGGLMLGAEARVWYDAVLTERWGGPDSGDELAWVSAWNKLGREGPGERIHLVTPAALQQALQPAPQAPDNGGQIQAQFPDWMEAQIQAEQLKMATRDEARRRLKTAELATAGPTTVNLHDFLNQPDNAVQWRVDGLWPSYGRVMLHAQFKAGKTTLLGNLVRSLADGDDFLDRPVVPLQTGYEAVALLDFELSPDNLRRWLRAQQLHNPGAVLVDTLRGEAHRFAITVPEVRARWAAHFRSNGVKVLILDPLAPILTALGIDENSNSEVGPFLTALDTLAAEAGLTEIVVAHHAGHTGERSRGASRFRDWPDAEWALTRPEEGGLAGAQRFFSAIGRDVDVPEAGLSYDEGTRRLSMVGGSRRSTAVDNAALQIREFLLDNPGAGRRDIEAAVHVGKTAVGTALTKMLNSGEIRRSAEGQKTAHYLNTPGLQSSVPGVPAPPGQPLGSVPHPIGGDTNRVQGQFGASGTLIGDSGAISDLAQPHAPVLTRERLGLMDRLQPPTAVHNPVDKPPPPPPPAPITESEPQALPDMPAPAPKPKRELKPGTKAYERAQAKAAEKAQRFALAAGESVQYPAVVLRDGQVLETPLATAEELLSGLPALTMDVESSGVPIGHRAYEQRMVQLGDDQFAVVLDPKDPEQMAVASRAIKAAPVLHAHSSTADVVPVALLGLDDFDSMMERMDDTAIRAKLHDPQSTGSDAGLKKISDFMLGAESASTPAEEARKELFGAGGWLSEPEPDTPLERNGWHQVDPKCRTFVRYGGSDVLDTALIAKRLPPLPPHIAERENAVAHMVSRVALKGIQLNGALVGDLMTEHVRQRDEWDRAIKAWTLIDNVGSGQQVAQALIGMGIRLPHTKPSKKYPEGQPSVAAGVLETLQGELEGTGHPAEALINQVLSWRHHSTAVNLFLTPYSVLVNDGDGRARPTVYTLGADTGRMSAVRPNIQQLPREGGFRAMFVADPGMTFISADFSSVEIRVAAALSQDQVLIRMLEEGLDPHGMAAELVFGPGYTKAQRYKVKSGVFGRIYGGGVSTLAGQMRVPIAIAQKLIDAIDTLWPTLSAWSKASTQAVERGLETTFTTYSGRIVHLPRNKAHAAGNYKIQGTAREILVDALMRWRETQWGRAIMWPVHDEVDVMVPIADAEAATAELVRCMETELYGVRIIAEPSAPSPVWQDAA